MFEYVFYVTLVFLPIAGVITYLLRKDGVMMRDIAIIILVALAIIIFFPVSIERLGIEVSLGIYMFILLLMGIYVFKAMEKSYFTASNGCTASFKGENLSVSDNLNNYAETVADKGTVPVAVAEDSNANVKNVLSGNADSANRERGQEPVPSEPTQAKEPDLLNEEQDVSEQIELKTSANAEEHLNCDVDAAGSDPGDIATNLQVEKPASGERKDSAAGKVSEVSDESDVVIELLEQAFCYKKRDNLQEAADCFRQAWEITDEAELKYILTLELFNICKDLGWYGEAEDILKRYVASDKVSSEAREEINNKLFYIRLITRELEHLGIDNIPLSKVPRLVRLRVAEEMKSL